MLATTTLQALSPQFSDAALKPAPRNDPVYLHLQTFRWHNSHHTHEFILGFTQEALDNIEKEKTAFDALEGDALVRALQKAGAVLHDAVGKDGYRLAAFWQYETATHQTTYLGYHQDGHMCNPSPHEPAKLEFRNNSLVRAEHWTKEDFIRATTDLENHAWNQKNSRPYTQKQLEAHQTSTPTLTLVGN